MPIVLHVWLPLPVPGLDYLPPATFGDADPAEGRRIAVPWQGGLRVGWVAGARAGHAAEALDLRPAAAWVDGEARLGVAVRTMLSEQAARCAVPIGVSVAAAASAPLRGPWRHLVQRGPAVAPGLLGPGGEPLADDRWHDAAGFDAELLDDWRRHGLVHERVAPEVPSERFLVPVRGADAGLRGAPRAAQAQALAYLEAVGRVASAAALARDADVPPSAARALVAKGYAAYVERPVELPPTPWVTPAPAAPFDHPVDAAQPTVDADVAVADDGGGWLLTGGDAAARWSTLVPWLDVAVAGGGQALLVVPEQAVAEPLARAAAGRWPTLRWGADVGDAAREAIADELATGTSAVVVGTPGALALDLPRLRRVAVWDAASASHKQLSGARSVTRIDAQVLARAAGAAWAWVDPLATAELRAGGAHHERVLPRAKPRAVVLDLRRERGWPLSAPLVRLLKQVADRGRQALVIAPRRGYAAALGCADCGEVVMCPHCDLPLRWHARVGRLRCHRCGLDAARPAACAECGGVDLAPRPGAGTEWVAETVRGVVPGLPVAVRDRDLRDDLGALYDGAPGVLVGTTAALRLPPLPALSLVALTAGDALHDHEDIRAEEGSLRTLLSLPDLAPHGRRPLLVAQAHRPEHAVWRAWTADDLDAAVAEFLDGVSERRRAHGYPPVLRWARVQLTHRDRATAGAAATAVAARLRLAGADVLGPAPAPIARARGVYAFHVFLRAGDDAALATLAASVDARPGGGVVARVDVDPYDLTAWID